MRDDPIHTKDVAEPSTEMILFRAYALDPDECHLQALVDLFSEKTERLAKYLYGNRHCHEFEYDDYRQFALIGLVESIKSFDLARGNDFWTYAQKRVKGSLLNGVASLSEKQRQINDTGYAWQAIDVGGNADNLPSEGAETLEDLIDLTNRLALGRIVARSGAIDSTSELAISHSGYERFEFQQLLHKVREVVLGLTHPIREIIESYYMKQETFQSIAVRLRLSKGRISQLHREGLEELREQCVRRRMIKSILR